MRDEAACRLRRGTGAATVLACLQTPTPAVFGNSCPRCPVLTRGEGPSTGYRSTRPGPGIGSGRACDPSRANGSDSFSRERLLTLVILHLLGRSSCLRPGTQERRPLLSSSPPRSRPLAPCFTVLIGNGIRMPPLQGCCQPPQTQDLSRRVENRARQDPSPRCLLPAKSCRPLNKMAASQSEFSPQIPD